MTPPSNAQAQIELHRALAPRYAYRYSFEFSRLFQQDWHAEMISHVPPGAEERGSLPRPPPPPIDRLHASPLGALLAP